VETEVVALGQAGFGGREGDACNAVSRARMGMIARTHGKTPVADEA
jgi:hypothetical protein